MRIRGENLEKKNYNGKSDPFLVFLRENKGEWEQIHKTDYFIQDLNPHFKPLELSVHELTCGKSEKEFKVKCYDWNINKKYSFIGEFDVKNTFYFYLFFIYFFV